MNYKKAFAVELEVRKVYIEKELKQIDMLDKGHNSVEIYERLGNIAGHIEKLSLVLREVLTSYHLQLQSYGLTPSYDYLNSPPEVNISYDGDILCLTFDALLPFTAKGGAFYLHGKLEDAILGFRQKLGLTIPLFAEKCGIIFYHHYDMDTVGIRNIRDFDNLEKRSVTNVLARHFTVDDNPFAVMSTDILVPDKRTYTEVKICSLPTFKSLISQTDL